MTHCLRVVISVVELQYASCCVSAESAQHAPERSVYLVARRHAVSLSYTVQAARILIVSPVATNEVGRQTQYRRREVSEVEEAQPSNPAFYSGRQSILH